MADGLKGTSTAPSVRSLLRDFYAEDETDQVALRRAQQQRESQNDSARQLNSISTNFFGGKDRNVPAPSDPVKDLEAQRALRDSQMKRRAASREESEGNAALSQYLQRQGMSAEDAQVMARNPRILQTWEAGQQRESDRAFRAGESEKDRALREREGARNRASQRELLGVRTKAQEEKAKAKSGASSSRKGHLPSTVASAMGDYRTAADAISRLEKAHGAKIGRGSALTQFVPGSDAKQYDDERRVVAQQFGLIMEGGKLAEADLPRYMAMLPDPADSPERARNKLAVVRRELEEKRRNQVEALAAGGYDMSAFSQPVQPRVPGSFVVEDEGDGLGPDDQAALDWATANPGDPRAAAILERLGVE